MQDLQRVVESLFSVSATVNLHSHATCHQPDAAKQVQ